MIKNLSRLLSSQKSKDGHVRYYCRRCCNSFTSKERLAAHNEICRNNETVKIEMLQDPSTQYFKNHFKSQNVPFVVYNDFESFTKPISSRQPDPEESYTKKYQKHEPSGFCSDLCEHPRGKHQKDLPKVQISKEDDLWT